MKKKMILCVHSKSEDPNSLKKKSESDYDKNNNCVIAHCGLNIINQVKYETSARCL